MAPNIAHSSALGSRPKTSRTRATSSGVRPTSEGGTEGGIAPLAVWLGCAVFIVPSVGDALTTWRSLRATASMESLADLGEVAGPDEALDLLGECGKLGDAGLDLPVHVIDVGLLAVVGCREGVV